MDRICFLFNHDQVHQIAHSLPAALALARRGQGQVTLAVTNSKTEQHVRSIAGEDIHHCQLVRLGLGSALSRGADHALGALLPAAKLLVYRDNLDFFRRFDALVVAEKTSLMLKQRYGLDRLRIIHTRHGAGDRAIGFGPDSAGFDLVLVAGPKIARRLEREAGVARDRIAVVGYPKFDLYPDTVGGSPFADRAKPVVLYNPHPSPRLSSWYRMGPALLEEFHRSGRYNLVFAPHAMMFARRWTVTIDPPALRRMRPPPARYREAPHMAIDLGSPATADMTYTNLADVYIGDVSSQIYEFLRRPRPCLHLDAHAVQWRDNPDYAHWRAGPVAEPGASLVAAVDEALATHAAYAPVQRALFADTFSVTGEPAAERAAGAIADFLQRSKART